MTKACVNSWKAAIAPTIRLNRIAGLIIGMVTWRSLTQAPAPSTSAAS